MARCRARLTVSDHLCQMDDPGDEMSKALRRSYSYTTRPDFSWRRRRPCGRKASHAKASTLTTVRGAAGRGLFLLGRPTEVRDTKD